MAEEKAYYRHVGEYSQRQGYLGESRVMTRLSWALGAERDRQEEGRERNQVSAAGRPKVKGKGSQNVWII